MNRILFFISILVLSVGAQAKLNPSEDPNLNIGNLGELHGKTVQLIGGTDGAVPGVTDGICTDPDGCPDEVVQASLGTAPDAFSNSKGNEQNTQQQPAGGDSTDQ